MSLWRERNALLRDPRRTRRLLMTVVPRILPTVRQRVIENLRKWPNLVFIISEVEKLLWQLFNPRTSLEGCEKICDGLETLTWAHNALLCRISGENSTSVKILLYQRENRPLITITTCVVVHRLSSQDDAIILNFYTVINFLYIWDINVGF